MINTNKRWLLTASPWMKAGHRSALLGIRGFLVAVLLLGCQAAFAQGGGNGSLSSHVSSIPSDLSLGGSGTPAPELPVITGGTTICVGTNTTLHNTVSGGTWTSSNTAIATVVSGTGLVTGVHGGVVTITYTVGIYSIATTITVTQPIVGASAVCVGNTLTLTDSTFTGNWGSSNPSVATVVPVSTPSLATGMVTGISAGTAIITYGRTGALCYVTDTVVVGANGVASINGIGTLAVCTSNTITATDPTPGGTWSSSTPAVASVVSGTGVITGVAAGSTILTYTVGTCFQTRPVIVTALSSILAITPASPTVCVGSTTALADLTPLGTWSSANPDTASISATGVVTGLIIGHAVIRYTKSGCTVTKTVTVNANTIGTITGNLGVCVGTPSTLSSSPAGGTWTSSNLVFATVGSATGTVTGLTAGYAIITYTQGGCFKTAMVTVNPASSVGAISGTGSICQGATSTLTDAVPGGVWSSSDVTKATINSYGIMTGTGAGNATISYSRLGCVSTTIVTVNALPASIGGTMNVCTGQNVTLTDATTPGTWSTSNAAIASIDTASGTVTGVAAGTVTITYKETTNGCKISTAFTVRGPYPISGGNIDCIAPLTYLYLSNSTLGGTWSSANVTIATVNATTGAVTGINAGTVNITYTQPTTGCWVVKPITVNFAPGNISGNFATCAGATTTLTDSSGGGVWASSNPAIATIGTTGIVSGLTTGGTVISYTKNGCTMMANVVVSASVNPITGPNSVCAGYATINLSDATTGGEWSTTSTYIYLSGSGVVTGGSVITGMVTTAVVNYTVGGCTVSKTITINPNPVTAPSGLPSVCNGSSITLTDLTPGGGTWSSQYPLVASVGAGTGVVTGLSSGTAAITFTGTGGCFKTFIVHVNDTPNTITGSWTVCAGQTTTLGGETGLGYGWITSNSAVASVDTIGNVTGVSVGTATITFARSGGCAVYHNMTVLANPSAISYKTTAAVCMGGVPDSVKDATTGGTWSSSATGVLTIAGSASTGFYGLTAVSGGTSVITYTGPNGCFVTSTATVNATPTAAITGNSGPTCVSSVLQLSDASGSSLGTWTSTTTTKATINTAGLVTGVATGTSVISYTYLGCIATTTVTVNANNVGAINGSTSVCISDTTTLSDTTAGGTWSTSNTSIGTIDASTGRITGISTGFLVVTYTSAGGCMTYINPYTVSSAMPAITGTATVCKGLTTTLSNAVSGGTWTTTSGAIATILSNGTLTGVAAGSTNVTYTVIGCQTNRPILTVTVLPVPATITGVPYVNKVCQGSSTVLTETVTGGTWTSSDVTLAYISGTTLTTATIAGASVGVPYITYTLPNGCFVSTVMSVGFPASPIVGSNVCSANSATFTDPTPGGSWSLTNGNAIIDATLGIINPSVTGAVDTALYTTPGCTAVSYVFTINPSPAAITGTFSVCKTSTTTLSDTSSGGTWTSSDVTIATIGTSGIVTGVNGGYVNISYTVANGCMSVVSAFYVDPCGHKSNPAPVATEQSYSLFPNPTNGNINITQAIPVDGTMEVTVLNAMGAKVYSGPVSFTDGLGSLTLSTASGMYLVMLQDNQRLVQTFKVVIER